MTTDPQPPPEAELIRTARTSPPLVKIRRAADLAGISEGRWRQLENGGWKRRGRWETEVAPADTLARMARAVGVTPAQLTAAGRPDAAAELEALAPLGPEPDNGGSQQDVQRLEYEVRSMRAEIDRLAAALERRNRRDGTQARHEATG